MPPSRKTPGKRRSAGADSRSRASGNPRDLVVLTGLSGSGKASALKAFEDLGGGELFLETNSILAPAITLYESVGFVHAPRPAGPAHYVRADVYMRYKGAP